MALFSSQPTRMMSSPDESNPHRVYAAIKAGDLETVEALLKNNPDLVHEKGDEMDGTPLHRAADRGETKIAELLLANGADINASDAMGARPLHWAADEDRKDVVELLLAKGVEIETRDDDGHTALHHAAAKGACEVAKFLLAHEADVNAKGDTKKTPLHWAVSAGHKEIAEMLLAGGADVNAKDEDEFTLLHAAVGENNHAIVELLLVNGADTNARPGVKGLTPSELAARFGYEDIRQLLSQYGDAKPADASSLASAVCPAAPVPETRAGLDPFDPQLERLMKAFSDALIEYTPKHFQQIHCVVREGLEGGQPALLYKISCPQYPEEGTSNPSPQMNVIAWQLQEYWAAREGSFPGFTMICRMEEDGTWRASLERLAKV